MNSTTRLGVFWGSARNHWPGVRRRWRRLGQGTALALTLAAGAPAQTYRVLEAFSGSDGSATSVRFFDRTNPVRYYRVEAR